MEEIYYKKILVSSGEVPEEEECYYLTDQGWQYFHKEKGFTNKLQYWLKETSVPSPKQETMEAYEDALKVIGHGDPVSIPLEDMPLVARAILSQYCEEFKEKGEK